MKEKPLAFGVFKQKLMIGCASNIYLFPDHNLEDSDSQSFDIENNKLSKNEKEVQASRPNGKLVPVLNSSYIKDCKNVLFKERIFTDIDFKIGEKIVSAHKFLLVARCQFFYEMFTSIFLIKNWYHVGNRWNERSC